MDCPICPNCTEYANRRSARVSVWAPLALIAAVLCAASFASSLVDSREPASRQGSMTVSGRAL